MANVRAGVAYVDVKLGSVEDMKRRLKKEMEQAGADGGKTTGEKFTQEFTETVKKKTTVKIKDEVVKGSKETGKKSGETAADNFQKSFSERVGRSAAILRGNMIALLLPVAVSLGPFLGATLGAAIIASLPLGAIGAGIALVAKDARVEEAGKELGQNLLQGLQSSALVLVQPVLDAIKVIKARFPELLKPIQGMFMGVSQYILPLVNSVINTLKPILEGMNVALQRSGPIFQVFLKGLERLGVVIGDFFKKITEDPEAIEGMTDALDDLFGILVLVIKWFGNFIVSASRAYAQFKDSWGAIKNWFSGTIVPSLKRAWDQLMSVFRAVGDFFKAWWERLKNWNGIGVLNFKNTVNTFISTAKGFVSKAATVIGQLPGKILAALSSLGSYLYNAGVNAMQGFLNGIAAIGPAIIDKARAIASTVVDTIMGALRIGSPSKVMEQIGKWTMQGFVKGMDSMAGSVAAYMPAPVQQITNNFGDVKTPQMDAGGFSGPALHIENYNANENVDPWRQAEDWYFMINARGGVA